MARLISRESVGVQRVYDITTTPTHSFLAKSGRSEQGSPFLLVHNSHRLSASALDALLKPLEENIRGTMDKKMICIFCTTEPERMRNTILSRCAPVFTIQAVTPETIGERLQVVCQGEGYEFEEDALVQIAEVTECHIRDALKAVEGISKVGPVDVKTVRSYFHLDLNDTYLDILLGLRSNRPQSLGNALGLLDTVSPVTCYGKLADLCLLAFKLFLGVEKRIPVYWDRSKLRALGEEYGEELLRFSKTFSSRPARPTGHMLVCDLATLSLPEQVGFQVAGSISDKGGTILKRGESTHFTEDGVYVVEAAVNRPQAEKGVGKQLVEMGIADFCKTLDRLVGERDGSTGRPDVGSD